MGYGNIPDHVAPVRVKIYLARAVRFRLNRRDRQQATAIPKRPNRAIMDAINLTSTTRQVVGCGSSPSPTSLSAQFPANRENNSGILSILADQLEILAASRRIQKVAAIFPRLRIRELILAIGAAPTDWTDG